MESTANWLTWTPEGKIVFAESIEGDAAAATVDPASARNRSSLARPGTGFRCLWGTNLSLARDGKISAIIRSSLSDPPEIGPAQSATAAKSPIATLASNRLGVLPRASIGKTMATTFRAGSSIPRFRSLEKISHDCEVHGGPGAAVQSECASGGLRIAMSGTGYLFSSPNPRGSFGQGEASRAQTPRFRLRRFRDVLAGVDEALRIAPIDPDRLGLAGWSYGGFMTMWAHADQPLQSRHGGAGIANY